ncbi:hypothetical protein HY416_04310 [Candidatus Kaiserbacteria bacterium]|nr:hypothetical protein [Candidatus Kaiserbacteria bacterium]
MKTRLNSAVATMASLAISAILITAAYAQSPDDIIYPIGALGNCESKEACRAYCDIAEHHAACQAFAEKHNLDDESGDKFDMAVKDGGPGGCAAGAADPRDACRQYCDSMDHMRECVAYAESHDLMDETELAEAHRVIAALDRGATLPPGCTNEERCHELCEAPPDVATARQCFAFAEAAGLLPPDVDREKAEMMFKAIEEGRAPFKTPKEFEQCENPSSDEIMQKCIDFGLENGFLSDEEAEMVKKTGGKGPGGCRGKEQCEAYCSTHQDECFAFGVEHGMIKPEDREMMKEGIHRFKEGFAKAPPEVKECLEESLGADTLDQMLSGATMPTEELGQKMRACFENHFGEEGGMMEGEGAKGGMSGKQFPPEVKACLESKIGAEGVKKMLEDGPDPSLESAMKGCFQGMMQNKQGEERYDDKEASSQGFQGEFKGPGGCTDPEECKRYCAEHPEACGMKRDATGFPAGANPEEIEQMMREKMMQEGREQYMQENEGQFPGEMNPEDRERMMEEKYEEMERDDNMSENFHEENEDPGTYDRPAEEPQEHTEPSEPAPTSRLPQIGGSSLIANVVSILLALLW